MTTKEVLEVFALFLLAYPNAETFKGNVEKLEPTAKLWSACLSDVDRWIGQQAAVKLIRESKYPPTIAEFIEKAEAVKSETQKLIRIGWGILMQGISIYGIEHALDDIDQTSDIRKAVDNMGGAKKLLVTGYREYTDGKKVPYQYYDFDGFRRSYEGIIRQRSALIENNKPKAVSYGAKQLVDGCK